MGGPTRARAGGSGPASRRYRVEHAGLVSSRRAVGMAEEDLNDAGELFAYAATHVDEEVSLVKDAPDLLTVVGQFVLVAMNELLG